MKLIADERRRQGLTNLQAEAEDGQRRRTGRVREPCTKSISHSAAVLWIFFDDISVR